MGFIESIGGQTKGKKSISVVPLFEQTNTHTHKINKIKSHTTF